MKHSQFVWATLLMSLLIFISGCIYMPPPGPAANLSATGSALSPQESEESYERIVTFTAVGKGLIPETAINTGQGKLLAERAAISDGYRQLVEKIKGVYIDAQSKTTNGFIDYDEIRTKTQSWLRGVEITNIEEGPHGIFSANMQLRIYFTQNDMIWWPEGIGSNVIPVVSRTKKHFFARAASSDIVYCETYPWCGNYYYYRPFDGR